jgi:hypothetical protein
MCAGSWASDGHSTPKTIAARNVKAAPTTMKCSGFVKLMEWPPLLLNDAY